MNCPPAPPAGTTWTGEWNTDHGDRIYGTDPVLIGDTAALLTGIQHRKGTTVSGVALRIQGTAIPDHPHGAITTDLTPTQARELAHTLTRLANQAETLDGLACRDLPAPGATAGQWTGVQASDLANRPYSLPMSSSDLEAQIAEIQSALLKRSDALGARVADTVWRQVDYYGDTGQIGKDELTADCRKTFRQIFQVLSSAGPYSTERPTEIGVARARSGIPLPAMLEAFGIAGRLARVELADLETARPDLSREAFLRISERYWLAHDAYTDAMADAYRDTVSRKILHQAHERAALAEALIDGRIVEQADLWEIAQMLKLPARGPYVTVAAECASVGRSALPGIEAKLDSLDIASAWRLLPDVQLGLVYVRDDAMLDLLKGTLARLAVNHVGISSRFDDLRGTPQGVKYARIALSVEPRDGSLVATFEATPLSIAAVSAPDVMKQLSSAVLAGFAGVNERERDILFTTFRAWVDAGGSIGEAAQRLHCHANTVRHRLRRVEEITGKSLGRPAELAELCLAFEIDLLVS